MKCICFLIDKQKNCKNIYFLKKKIILREKKYFKKGLK